MLKKSQWFRKINSGNITENNFSLCIYLLKKRVIFSNRNVDLNRYRIRGKVVGEGYRIFRVYTAREDISCYPDSVKIGRK